MKKEGVCRQLAGLLGTLIFLIPGGVHANEVRILSVTPGRLDSTLVCGVTTQGLPDGPSRETLESGLPSAMIFAFSILDASGNAVGGSRSEVRIEPDLWENVFFLRSPMRSQRASSLRDVERLLGQIQPIPIFPLARLQGDASYRIRVRLAVYPLAPSEIRRSRDQFTGESTLDDPDRREISVGLNSLLKFFLGKEGGDEWVDEQTSVLFQRHDLPRLPLKESETN